MSEFNLSEKSLECGYCMNGSDEPHICEDNLMFYKTDVKEFIKRLKKSIKDNKFNLSWIYIEEIDKLAGEKLI